MKKSQKGFTLIELVVVIAIIGVLAAILVPSMLNYVKKSRLKSANSNAKTAYNAIAEYVADAEVKGSVEASILSNASGSYDAAAGSGASDVAGTIYDALADNGDAAGYVYIIYPQTLNNGTKTFVVQWATDTGDTIVGQYPDAIDWDKWSDAGGASFGTYFSPA